MSIKVFLADDHHLLVAGFRQVLGNMGVSVVGVAHTLNGLIQSYVELKPDVLVIDIRFDKQGANENGLDFCEQLLEQIPSANIVVFSQFDDQYIVEKSYKLGVRAFVRKDESVEVLMEAIKSAANREQYFSPAIARLLAFSAIKDTNPKKLLASNELRAFILTADGATQAEIGADLGVSLKTVSTLMGSVKQKLGIESHADMTKLAIKNGLTTTEQKTKN